MKTMTKALCCTVLACGGAAMAAGTLRWTPMFQTPVFRPMPIEVRPDQGASAKIRCLTNPNDNDATFIEYVRQLLCSVWRTLLGCTQAPGKLPQCCGGDWTGDNVDGSMSSVMNLYATSGVPTGLSTDQIKDLRDTIAQLKALLTGTLPAEIDPSIAAMMVETLNKILSTLGE